MYDGVLAVVAVNLNATVVNVDFRNGPEVKPPTGANDFRAVLKYMKDNGGKHDINPKKICVAGMSGGGWIVTGAINQIIKNKEHERGYNPRCVIL